MNTISKVAILITSFCLFLPAYAQDTASTGDPQMQKYTQALVQYNENQYRTRGSSETEVQAKLKNDLPGLRETAERKLGKLRADVRRDYPTLTQEQFNQEVDKQLNKDIANLHSLAQGTG